MRKNPTILVVDDNENLCKVMSIILKRKGYNVTTATNGLEAIGIMHKIPHDIVLMDIKMPLVDGIDAYLAIKDLKYDIKTIIMTAYTSEERIKHYMNNGIYDIIFKPIDINKILKLIEEICDLLKDRNTDIVADKPHGRACQH